MSEKKNMVLILCDQLRWDAMGCYGNEVVKTPWIDMLARDGMCFDRAYSQTPVCVPARYGLLDGKNPCRLGIWENDVKFPNVTTPLPAIVKKQGYFCCSVGKMHYTPAREHYGFDRRYLSEEVPEHFDDDDYLQFLSENGYGDITEPHGQRGAQYYVPQISPLPPEMHTTGWTGTKSCEFLRKNRDRLFFLVTSFIKPHPPFDAAERYLNLYQDVEMPKAALGELLSESDLSLQVQNSYKMNGKENITEEYVEKLHRYYYASITQIDEQVGNIICQLKELGLYEDTLIVFTSDHGELLGDHQAVGKRSYYDGSCRIPLIVSCPSLFKGGRRSEEIAMLEDVYATLIELSGEVVPDATEGVSLLPVCEKGGGSTHEMIFGGIGQGPLRKYTVIGKEWKYIYTVNGGKEYLLNVQQDPEEKINYAEEQPDICRQYRNALKAWLQRYEISGTLEDGELASIPLVPTIPPIGFLKQEPVWPTTVHTPMGKK